MGTSRGKRHLQQIDLLIAYSLQHYCTKLHLLWMIHSEDDEEEECMNGNYEEANIKTASLSDGKDDFVH